MTSITTTDINEAVATLRTGNCTGLNATGAGWCDTELFEIIKCIAIGLGEESGFIGISWKQLFERRCSCFVCYHWS